MTLVMQRDRTTPIGVDLGHATVQTIQLRKRRQTFEVLSQAQCDCRTWNQGDAVVGDRAMAIKACGGQGQFAGKRARTALCPPHVEFHALELPEMAMNEADQMVKFEVERLTTFDSAVETRYWRLPSAFGSAPNAIGVVARVETVTEALRQCDTGGFDCVAVDTIGAALVCFGGVIRPVESGKNQQIWSLLDVGAEQIRLVCCLEDTPILVRNVGAGADDWTRLIAEALQIAPASAEVQKREHGIALGGRGVRTVATGAQPNQRGVSSIIFSVLRKSLHDLSVAIRRSYEYLLSCYPGTTASDMVLVGGGALLTNLDAYLADSLGIEVQLASHYLDTSGCPLRYRTAKRMPLELFALSIGSAIAGL